VCTSEVFVKGELFLRGVDIVVYVCVRGFRLLPGGGVGILSGVVRECPKSKWDWSVVSMV